MRIFKSTSLGVAGVLLGAFFVMLGLLVVIGGGAVPGSVIVLMGLADAAMFIRVRLIANSVGVEIRNPLSTVRMRWDEISRFRLGSHGLMSAVCVVERTDGSASYAFAIQRALAGVGPKELAMVDELNGLLRTASSPSTA